MMDSPKSSIPLVGRQTKRIAPTNSMAVSPNSSNGEVAQSSSSPAPAMVATGGDFTSMFECPVCFDYVLPPIMQCQNGHLVCSSCRTKLSSCPTCRVPIANNIRNLFMEKLASTMMFPCKYSSSGCPASLTHTDKIEHEESCEFKPYSCPCPGKWKLTAFSLTLPSSHSNRPSTVC